MATHQTTKSFANLLHKQENMAGINPSSTTTTPAVAAKQLLQQEKRDAKMWNRIANHYSKQPIQDETSYQTKLSITRRYLHPNSKVLEFGCGTGGTALLHASFCRHIDAIDFSKNMIDIAKAKAAEQGVTNVKFDAVGVDRLEAPDQSYDVVLGLNVLHLLPTMDHVLNKVNRLLKPGGVFVSSTPCLTDQVPGFVRWVAPVGRFLGVFPPLVFFTKKELLERLDQAGFEAEEEFHPGKDKAVFLVARKK